MKKNLNTTKNGQSVFSQKIEKMPHVILTDLTDESKKILLSEYERHVEMSKETQSIYPNETISVCTFEEFVAKKVNEWNMFIDSFNNGDLVGRHLYYEFCKYKIEQYNELKKDFLKRDALIGDRYAAYEYANLLTDRKEKGFYLNLAATKGHMGSIELLVEGEFDEGEKYQLVYDLYKKLEKTKLIVKPEKLKDAIEILFAELEENPETFKVIFPVILSLIGSSQNDEDFDFDSYLIKSRIGCGFGLSHMEWKCDWAPLALAKAVSMIGDYSNIEGILNGVDFSRLIEIIDKKGSFDDYLFFAIGQSQGKLFEGGLPTSYECMVKLNSLKKSNLKRLLSERK